MTDTITTTQSAKRARNSSVILTDRMCEKRVTERDKVYDRKAPGLYISRTPSGMTAFNLKFSTGAKQRSIKIGDYNSCAPMLEFALDYARRGWPVFPCKPTNKAPFFEGSFRAATTSEETIRKWWGYWPRAMIGVPMGSRSGVWAVDTDPPKKPEELDGRAVWAGLLQEHGKLPATHTEITPRDGQHIFLNGTPTGR